MQPDEVEQLLYEHAIRTKIRAPFPERLSNLGYGRMFTSGIVAAAALICSLVMSKSTSTAAGNVIDSGTGHAQFTDNSPTKQNSFHQTGSDPSPASLAMSPVGG